MDPKLLNSSVDEWMYDWDCFGLVLHSIVRLFSHIISACLPLQWCTKHYWLTEFCCLIHVKRLMCMASYMFRSAKYSIVPYSTIASGDRVDEESKEMRAPNSEVCQDTESAPVVHSHTSIYVINVMKWLYLKYMSLTILNVTLQYLSSLNRMQQKIMATRAIKWSFHTRILELPLRQPLVWISDWKKEKPEYI